MELNGIFKNGRWATGVTVFGLGALLAGCGEQESPSDIAAETALVQVALTSVPKDVACVRATVTGRSRTVVRTHDVKPGSPSTFTIQGLPTGGVTFDMDAFSGACPQGPKDSTPSWISDTQNLILQGGLRTSVSVVLRPNGVVDVKADFQPDEVPPPPVALQFFPAAFDFGPVPVGGSRIAFFRLSNPSTAQLSPPQILLKSLSEFAITQNNCRMPLPPGGVCDVTVTFSPTVPSQRSFASLIATSDGAFASAEISGSSLGGPPPPPAGLIGHWSFDGVMGSFVPDQSGFGNNGEVTLGSSPNRMPVPATIAPGKIGAALDLSAPQTSVRVRRSDSIDSTGVNGAFTVAAWVNPGPVSVFEELQQVIARQEADTAFQHFALGLKVGKPIAGVHFFFAEAPQAIPAGQWAHLAATYDGITLNLFVNGMQASSLDIGWPIAADTTDTIIGGAGALDMVKQFFGGLVDEVRLYNTNLSPQQIAELAASGK
ncbi:MAG: LamG-like jellyroll fold domain-containing protein [Deltaproteobacteria bacterium]|nr:LamG-like jellyroll fold domain-containing protein [Deltaproteobacteria bacterium]